MAEVHAIFDFACQNVYYFPFFFLFKKVKFLTKKGLVYQTFDKLMMLFLLKNVEAVYH